MFWNAVVKGRWAGSPYSLLERLLMFESLLGRRRDLARPKGPRIIDLDLILASEHVLQSSRLIVPHPRRLERRFVLDPLAELEPSGRDPTTGVLWTEAGAHLLEQTVERSFESW
jgi:2-amino-4-hydroxy-6-hydroxymethyldihydropteridine diphosphokinase